MDPTDDILRTILTTTRTIALVGLSANPGRPSNSVGHYLVRSGYRVIGVNPGLAGQVFFDNPVAARLADITEPVDMVDIFRASESVLPVVEEALAHLPALKTIWMQLGVINEQAAALAHAKGVTVVMNRCPAIERPRLMGR
jgi:uncharacterized protein